MVAIATMNVTLTNDECCLELIFDASLFFYWNRLLTNFVSLWSNILLIMWADDHALLSLMLVIEFIVTLAKKKALIYSYQRIYFSARSWFVVATSFILSQHICYVTKKRLQRRCFLVKLAKFLRIPFSTKQLWWLLLKS